MASRGRRGHGEGSIYQRQDGRWVASITLGGRKRKYLYGETRKEVQEQLKVALREQQQGMLLTGPRQTVEQFLTYWLEDVHKPLIRVTTYARYKAHLRSHILPVIGQYQLQKLSAQHVRSFYAEMLKKGLSAKSITVLHAILHKAFDHAVHEEMLVRNVFDVVSAPRVEKHEIHSLTLEQIQRLLQVAKGHKIEALFVLALVTGMRRGELLGLKWGDLNVAKRILYVRRTLIEVAGEGIRESETKTAKGRRSIQLPSFVLKVLEQHRTRQAERKQRAEMWEEHDLMFCTSHGTPFAAGSLYRMFKALLIEGGLPNVRFHDLRHSAATLLLSMGTHPKVVQELLGHSKISMTMDTYSHVLPTMQEGVMRKMDELFRLTEQESDEGKGEDGEADREK